MIKDKTALRDLILVVVIITIAIGFRAGYRFAHRKPSDKISEDNTITDISEDSTAVEVPGDDAIVEVSVDGVVVQNLDLSVDGEFIINGNQGGTNTLVIENGEAYIADASCPDKICIHQGKISQSGEMIVCLPNLMIAKIVWKEE